MLFQGVFRLHGLVILQKLNPCDFWLWGFLKDYVYRGKIQTLPEMKASILHRVSSIDLEILRATVEQAITRFERVIDVNGMHI